MDLPKRSPELAGEDKLKKSEAEGRNRRVLQDIGNRVTRRAGEGKVEGKPQAQIARPTTRFGAELLAKAQAQAIAEKNKQRAAVAPKKVCSKPKPEDTVIVISSDDEEEGKKHNGAKPAAATLSKKVPSRTKTNTFTSVLTARSKVSNNLYPSGLSLLHVLFLDTNSGF